MTKTLKAREPGSVPTLPFSRFFPHTVFDHLFDQYAPEGNGQIPEVMNALMDVAETDQAFEVKMDLPGVNVNDVDIQIDNNTLTVRGKRCQELEETNEEKQYHRIERYSGTFSRSVVLPNSINEDETAAEFKDGVLTIMIPKSEDSRPRQIRITT